LSPYVEQERVDEVRVLLAGATGVIGHRLVPLLLDAGHAVGGTTRSSEKAAQLKVKNVSPVIVDVRNRDALIEAVQAFQPEIIIDQVTDLPQIFEPANFDEVARRNAATRKAAARNLVQAASQSSARRVIAQSLGFSYAPGPEPHLEADPLDIGAEGGRALMVDAVAYTERLLADQTGIEGITLRYGYFYGPGTWFARPLAKPALHVDAAAHAALLAIAKGPPGIYNIADDDGAVSIAKARAELGFDPGFRLA
jgi:nucleoside-diphosphate-sugar epimerase